MYLIKVIFQKRVVCTKFDIYVFIIKFLKVYYIRERPFNLKMGGGGGGCWFFSKNILIPNVAEKNILILVEDKK